MSNNLPIHAPVPALCDYLRMSPSTLHRFFLEQTGTSPGRFFRKMKTEEARRLIRDEGWQVKAAAWHLGYQHANDLSRALSGR
jgi:AraC-like DNA-binding protein